MCGQKSEKYFIRRIFFKEFSFVRYHTLFSIFVSRIPQLLSRLLLRKFPKRLVSGERKLLQQTKFHLVVYLNSRTNFPRILDSAPKVIKCGNQFCLHRQPKTTLPQRIEILVDNSTLTGTQMGNCIEQEQLIFLVNKIFCVHKRKT